ncbi:hypothetical protein HYT26_04725 [Candidatus Pacearchaeota archaeon]|nr:hypothetical protein [Candidatus Pacearchaeota archaeon]
MRKKSAYILTLMFLLLIIPIMPFAFAQNQTAIDKGYSCLTSEANSRIATFTSEEISFSLLALSYNSSMSSLLRGELLKKNQSNCWPAGNCRLRDTALAAIALKNINEDTATFTNWLSSQNSTPSDLIWYLQIDPNNATDCTLTYDGSSYSTSVRDDKTLSSGAGSCLPLDSAGYWLQIASSCQNKEFSISCKSDFKTTLLYKKDSTIYVSDKTSSAPKEGTTKEKISILCFAQGGVCNYEGSAWAAYALKKAGQNIDVFTPYLIAFSSDNQEIIPEAFLYLLLGKTDYKTSVSSKQSSGGYWDTGNVQYNLFYDTALALLSLAQRVTSAEDYLLNPLVQGSNGCWNNNNVRDTAFVLYSAWSKAIPSFSISISPSSVTVMPNETIQFTASITGIASTAVVWSLAESSGGAINSTGFYNASSIVGTYHVTAALQSNTSKNATASVAVSLTPSVVISISPSSVTISPNATQQFTASVTGTANRTVIWSVQEADGGTINSTTGFYRAPNVTGTFHVIATLQSNASLTATITISVSLPSVPVYCEEEGGYCLGITKTQCTNANASILSDFVCSSGKICCSDNVTVDKTCSQNGGQKCPAGKTCPSDSTLIAKDAAYGLCCEKSSYCITTPQTCSQLNGELCSSSETCPVSQIFNASNVNYGRCCKKNECVSSGQKTCSQLGGRKCTGGKVCSGTEISGANDIQSSESCCSGSCTTAPTNNCERNGNTCKSDCGDGEEVSQYSSECASGKICCKSKEEAGKFPWFIVVLSILIILAVLGILFREKLRMLFFRFSGKGKTGPAPPQTRPPFPPMPPSRIMQPRMIMRPPTQPINAPRAISRPASSQTDKELEDTFKKLREMSK